MMKNIWVKKEQGKGVQCTISSRQSCIDIMEDIREECGKFGDVNEVKIPRPQEGQDNSAVGKVKTTTHATNSFNHILCFCPSLYLDLRSL